MTKPEIDKTIAFLIETKKAGQFRAFWKTFDESVNLMASGEVIIQSMWSPAVAAVRSKGIACVYQPLAEGYRAWGGGLGIAKHLSGIELDAAYEYINWYLSGWVGAYLNRQGYYSAVLETAKQFMTPGRVGLLDGGQAGEGRHPQSRGQGDGEGRRGARRRIVPGTHGPRGVLEFGDDRGPLHGPEMERVHRGVTLRDGLGHCCRPCRSPWCSCVFLLVPMVTLIVVSFFDYDSVQIIPGFVLTNYSDVLFSATTWRTYLETLKFTVIVWALTLLIGFWVAYFLTFVVRAAIWQRRCSWSARCRS